MSFISYDRFAAARRLASGLLCSLVSILFSLSVSDLALRYFFNDGFSYRPDDQLIEYSPIWQGAYRYKPNQIVEKMSWGDLANFSCEENNREYRKVKFITDEHGFRNTTIMPNIALDIVVLGDSFALGSGVTQSQTFTSILASELKKRTYNLAVPGTPRSQVRDLLAEMSHLRISNTGKLIWMILKVTIWMKYLQ